MPPETSRVLALKYRPQSFEDVVGQETTVQILKNALTQKRLHHAYLFTGPRGVGKTSLARIFAKSVNCEKGPTAIPCNECISCREITEGKSMSVIEIDGASNTSVEDVRDLREKIRYLPPGGRYKIYIVDEVHMLSTAAFNALLKTLEEPPPHALFIFATTDPQKVPATVLSRLIRFDLRPILRTQVVDRLKKISGAEELSVDDEALFLIAREAQGGLRDALSLLDQIISFSGVKKINVGSVEEVIGVSPQRFVSQMTAAILAEDSAQVLKIAEEATNAGIDIKRLSMSLLEQTRHLLVSQVSQEPALFDLPLEEINELMLLSKPVRPEDLDRLFRMLQKGVTELLRSPLPKVYLDVLLLRLCHYKDLKSLDEILKILNGAAPAPQAAPVNTPAAAPVTAPVHKPVGESSKNWDGFLSLLRSKKPQAASMIQEGTLTNLGEREAVLKFPPQSIHVSLLQDAERDAAIRELLSQFFGRPLVLRYEVGVPKPVESSSNIIDDAMQIFETRGETQSTKPMTEKRS